MRSLGSETTLTLNGGNGTNALLLDTFETSAQITFNGGAGVDSIEIDDTADFTFASTYTLTKTTFDMVDNFNQHGFGLLSFASIDSLKLTTNSEGDIINIDSVGAGVPTTVIGGFKPDTFNIGNGDIDTNIAANVSVVGEQGGDTVILDDATDAGDDAYSLAGGVFSKANVVPTIAYNFIEHVQLNANPGNNSITFVSPGFATDATLHRFAGADTFHITPSAQASISIEGSDPTIAPGDVLQFVNATRRQRHFTPNGAVNGAVAFASAKTVTFTGIETFPSILAAPKVPDLDAADDTGISNSDNITNNIKPAFSGSAPPKIKVELQHGHGPGRGHF